VEPPEGTLPKVRRQVERICDSIGVDFADLAELRIEPGLVYAFVYSRDADGELVRDDVGQAVAVMSGFPVDTDTFLGDERDH
jgi:hypothetical protein